MKKFQISLYAIAAMLLVTLGFNLYVMANDDHKPNAFASWDFNPTSLVEMKEKSTKIVVGTVVKVEQGADIVQKIEGEPTDQIIPTQIITLEVTQSLKGNVKEGKITIFRTGGENLLIEGDPVYTEGSEHLLFLRPQEGSDSYLVVSPEGRYSIENGKLQPVVEQGFGKEFKGLDLKQFKNLLDKKQ
jgi:hypothetical protein